MTNPRATRVVLLATFFILAAGPAAAQNGYSFLDAARSAIDYRVSPASPRLGCRVCFTRAQVDALKAIYGGVVIGGKPYFPGQPVGAEKVGKPFLGGGPPVSGWDQWLIAESGKSRQLTYGETFVRHMGFPKPDPNYDWRTFDFDKDPQRMDGIRAILDARNPDLSELRARGGGCSWCPACSIAAAASGPTGSTR